MKPNIEAFRFWKKKAGEMAEAMSLSMSCFCHVNQLEMHEETKKIPRSETFYTPSKYQDT
jgi:hypothetical protein